MEQIDNLILTALNSLADDIRQNMANKNENATGRTSASFKVMKTEKSYKLISEAGNHAPIESLEIGHPPSFVELSALEEWANAKFGFVGKDLTSFAIRVRKKIANVGTDRHINYKQGSRTDIYSSATNETAEILSNNLRRKILEIIKTEITQTNENG
jgi:hypothetical protein